MNVWPETVAGWFALVASMTSLALMAVGYGKWLEKINGMGRRMKIVEDEQKRAQGTDVERRREIDRVLGEHAELLRAVGESKKSADQCLEDAERHAIELGAKVSEVRDTLNASTLTISERLTAVETELRITRGGAKL